MRRSYKAKPTLQGLKPLAITGDPFGVAEATAARDVSFDPNGVTLNSQGFQPLELLASRVFAFLPDAAHLFDLRDVRARVRDFARGIAHVHFDRADGLRGRFRFRRQGRDVAAHTDDEVVHRGPHAVRG